MGRVFIIGVILLIGGIVAASTGASRLSGLLIIAMGLAWLGVWALWFWRRGPAELSAQFRRPGGGHWRRRAP
ncbi:MAG TPA: hypothetical protein VFH56_07645 [Acidimicrobiales bacterium]|nr:hypothetical protein [Acidimicrobiales bacterium]